MSATVFVDTNVLVYLRDASEPTKQPRAAEWMAALWDTGLGRISYQVLHEYYVTVTAKLDPGLSSEAAREDVAALKAWEPRVLDHGVLEPAFGIQDRYGLSFWDSLIAAAASSMDCSFLLTEDISDGQDLFGVRVIDPFSHHPDEVLAF